MANVEMLGAFDWNKWWNGLFSTASDVAESLSPEERAARDAAAAVPNYTPLVIGGIAVVGLIVLASVLKK
jgi:hypothetical protein